MAAETRTGGRDATTAIDPGRYALSVGLPARSSSAGWRWTRLTQVARLESGHTPSRKHPEYWGGDVPWIGIKDATHNDGRRIDDTLQKTTAEGIENSSARLLPRNTVCLSRTASVGYVVVMGREMATSQDFVNWVCDPEALDWRFLKWVLLAEREALRRWSHGTTHQTIYFPEVKAFHICLPRRREQEAIADVLGALDDRIESNRRLSGAALNVLDASFGDMANRIPGRVALGDVATVVKSSVAPASMPNEVFEQFSIPAFDDGNGPEVCVGSSMASAKTLMPDGVVLLSKLNPATKRVWWPERLGIGRAVCSPEFVVLAPSVGSPAWIYGCVAFDSVFYGQVLGTVSGTTGSRQRVRPRDVLAARVPDANDREITQWDALARPLLERNATLLRETRTLASIRDALLPKLVSGELRVPLSDDVEEQVGAVTEALV